MSVEKSGKMLRSYWSVALAVMFSGSAWIDAVAAEPLQPVRNWNVDFREDQCLASRDYGAAERPIKLGIRPSLNGQSYEMIVSRPSSGPSDPKELKGSVDFGGGPIRAWLLVYGTGDNKTTLYQFRISASEMEQARTARTVAFDGSGTSRVTFALTSMPQLLKGLEACTADLRQYWNADGEKAGPIARGAKPADGRDIRSIFSADDYPGVAMSLSQSGKTQYTLLIDEKGRIGGCHVVEPSGVPVLDAMGCQVLRRRARFTPALDLGGKPVRSTVTTPPVVWRIEG